MQPFSQAFDRIWHPGLLYKLKHKLTSNYYLLLKSYLADRNFAVRHNNILSYQHPIEAGVQQGSVLGPLLFLIFTTDIPKAGNTTIATFANDVAVLSSNKIPYLQPVICKLTSPPTQNGTPDGG